MTIYHLRDLASGIRRIIHCDNVKVFQVPHYEGLTIETMLEFAKEYPSVAECLPVEPREVLKLPRSYISNIIYTEIGEPFAKWVAAQIKARNTKIENERDLLVQMDPTIATIFAESSSISGKY